MFVIWIPCLFLWKRHDFATTLCSLRKDRPGVHDHASLGGLRAACSVSRVHVPCAMRCFFSNKKTQAAGPNRLGATLSLRTRVQAPASVTFFFHFRLHFFLHRIFFVQFWCFRSNTSLRIHLSFGTARHSSCLSPQGQVWYLYFASKLFGRVCRVSRVHVPCVVRDVFF